MKKVLLIGGSNNGLKIETTEKYIKVEKELSTSAVYRGNGDEEIVPPRPQYDEYYVERLKLGDQYLDFGILMGKSIYWAIQKMVEVYR